MERLSAAAVTRLLHEMKDLAARPIEGITVFFNEEDVADITAELEGPAGTPYEGGLFKMKLELPDDFPTSAPKGFFLTKVFHPNVKFSNGEICVNTLKRDWQPSHGIRHILQVVRCLLIEPFPESALNEEAAKLLLEEYEEYFKRARLMADIHARPPCDKRAAPMGNATNTVAGAEGDAGGEGCDGKGLGPPAKKLDRKKSLKRL